MSVPAYYCGFSSSPGQKGWTATVQVQDARGRFRELAKWECGSMTRGEHKRQASVVLRHLLGRQAAGFVVDALVDRPAHSLTRMEIPELKAWVAAYAQMEPFL